MNTIAEILDRKGHTILAVQPDQTVYEAIELMSEKHVGALLVMSGATLVGVITERDYARKVILRGRMSRETKVSAVMTTQVLYVRPWNTVDECMALMTDKRIRHLPVLVEDRCVGVVSIGDLVKAKIDNLNYTVKHLENYITGAYPA